jgi:cytochrome P450
MNQHSPITPDSIPPHIDPARVVDYDMFADHRYAEEGSLHDGLYRLAEEAGRGMFWTPRNGGHWFITDHELIFEAARTPELFSNQLMSVPPMPPELEPKLIPLNLDAPDHGKYRLPLMRAFSPDRMRALEPHIRAFAVELIEAVADKGACDFCDTVSEPLPIVIFMKMMGLDLSRRREFREWTNQMLMPGIEDRAQAHRNVTAMVAEVISERRIKREEDLVSWLLDSEIDGQPINDADMIAYCILLFAAGLDTVANSMAFGMDHLARDPALQERLRAEPALIPEAVEEILRRYGVVLACRNVAHDGEFHGIALKAGERVTLMLPLGNLDPAAFPDPARFDVDRENKAHMTFNTGPHRCIGSHLARIELNTLFEEWLKRMPNVRHDPAQPSTYRAALILALATLPLVWDPA